MPQFKVLLNGVNYVLPIEGKPSRMGFYTTRFVNADSTETAELAAVDLIRQDPKLADVLNDKDDPPVIYVEEIKELEENGETPPQQGFVFYDDEKGS